MNVLMISPNFPVEMPFFARGLAAVGARVVGLGDGPESSLSPTVRESLSAYFQAPSLADEGAVISQVHQIARQISFHRIECLWEPFMVLAAKLRETLGVPGMTVAETIPFRDKEIMKRVLDEAGIRTPRHAGSLTAKGVRDAAEHVGFPLIVKPIDGAGSSNTYKISSPAELERILPFFREITEVSVEEFVEGEDMTYDTLCIDGEIRYFNLCVYRPRALIAKENEWVSPQTVALRDIDDPGLAPGRKMGEAVLKALGFKTGLTHMEWYRTPSGEAVFGEIAARPPGAHTVDLMNFACDIDLFTGWAEATCHGRFSQSVQRKYNSVWIFKRAQGRGRIQRIEGLEKLMAEIGPHVCVMDLLPVGSPRRNWKQVLKGDGMVVLRHPDLQRTLEMADRVGVELQLYAG